MTTLMLGINHNTAGVHIRERAAFAAEDMEQALRQACAQTGLKELVIVSTCNRTELYGETGEGAEKPNAADPELAESSHQPIDGMEAMEEKLLQWLAARQGMDAEQLRGSIYRHRGEEAVRHAMKVASGLDSMVLGEPQILGQLKSAYAVARAAGAAGTRLGWVFEEVFAVAKQVRSNTAIGRNPVSVAFAAVALAQQIFSDVPSAGALLIGAGRTIELAIQHLKQAGVSRMAVANRTLEHAQELKEKYGVNGVLLADIPEQLMQADLVISSTASQLPILGKGAVERALKARRHKPVLMIDLAVPRDIEPQVAELDDVFLYNVDDLSQVLDRNMQSRRDAAQEAEGIIARGVRGYLEKQGARDAVPVLTSFRRKAEGIRDAELDRAIKLLDKGEAPREVLATLARLLTSKLLHAPSVQIRKAGADGRNELLELAELLFELQAGNEAADEEPGDAKTEDAEPAGRQSGRN